MSQKKIVKKATKKQVLEIIDLLNETFGKEYVCYLNHETPWQLLFATILSAQCTDERVNQVTKDLFVKYPTLEAFANADLAEMERDIYSTGFYKNKAKNIIQKNFPCNISGDSVMHIEKEINGREDCNLLG